MFLLDINEVQMSCNSFLFQIKLDKEEASENEKTSPGLKTSFLKQINNKQKSLDSFLGSNKIRNVMTTLNMR